MSLRREETGAPEGAPANKRRREDKDQEHGQGQDMGTLVPPQTDSILLNNNNNDSNHDFVQVQEGSCSHDGQVKGESLDGQRSGADEVDVVSPPPLHTETETPSKEFENQEIQEFEDEEGGKPDNTCQEVQEIQENIAKAHTDGGEEITGPRGSEGEKEVPKELKKVQNSN